MPLNIKTKNRNGKHVAPGFADMYRRENDNPLGANSLSDLVFLVATVLDESAVSDDTCVILGTTRDRSSYSCTVKYAGQTATVYGATCADLVLALNDLLTN